MVACFAVLADGQMQLNLHAVTCVTSKVDPLLTAFLCMQTGAEAAALMEENAVLYTSLARLHAGAAAESRRWELSRRF